MCATSRDLTHRDVNFTTTNQELRILFSPYEYMRRFGSDSGITQVASTANHAIEFLLSTATYPSYQKLPDHICAWRSIWSLERLELDNRVSPTLLSCARPGTCAELFAEDPLFISTSLHQSPFFISKSHECFLNRVHSPSCLCLSLHSTLLVPILYSDFHALCLPSLAHR